MHHQSRCCETSREDVLATIRQYVRPLHSLAQAVQPGGHEVYEYLDDVGRFAADAYNSLGDLVTGVELGPQVRCAVTDVRSRLAAVAATAAVALVPASWQWPVTSAPQRELVEAVKRLASGLWAQYRDIDAVLAEWSAGRGS